ncbi:MAG: helix-turn-helix transcriptional regulator [Pseudomonadota bacterium]
MAQTRALIEELKRALREAGLTYRDVAAELDVSEATVKRLFSEATFSMRRLEQTLALVKMDFTDLVERLRSNAQRITELTPEQEEALVADPLLLLVTFLVVNRWRVDDMLAVYAIPERELQRRLIRLDRLKMIELAPFNRYRLLTARNFSWRRNGPVQQAFAKLIQNEFFAAGFDADDERLRFLTGGLSRASRQRFNERLDQLVAEFDELALQDARLPREERQTTSTVLALRPIEYSLFARYRR